jgi:hypothetical protein
MNKKLQIRNEANVVYWAIQELMKIQEVDYCQSWWLNTRNFTFKTEMSTQKINQRAKLLVKEGYLKIDSNRTSTSTGTCYQLTEKKFNQTSDEQV